MTKSNAEGQGLIFCLIILIHDNFRSLTIKTCFRYNFFAALFYHSLNFSLPIY